MHIDIERSSRDWVCNWHPRMTTAAKLFLAPASALAAGFENEPRGAHTSRTMMLTELRSLLAACPQDAPPSRYRDAVVDENVLLKKTVATRRVSFSRLRELYSLDHDTILFRALRDLWDGDVMAQPLLALLCASARDPLLRATADTVLSVPRGNRVAWQSLSKAVDEHFPRRYNPTTLDAIGQHAASSWLQSGHLRGKLEKIRSQADSKPSSVAYALLLGHLCGTRGEGLFQTVWSRLLDAPPHALHEQAAAASQRGWIDYRRSGNVTEVRFSYLLRGHDREYK